MPHNVYITQEKQLLQIRIARKRETGIQVMLFSLVWMAVLGLIFWNVYEDAFVKGDTVLQFILVMPVLFILLGVFLFFLGWYLLLSKVVLRLEDGRLFVQHSPLGLGNATKVLVLDEVKEFCLGEDGSGARNLAKRNEGFVLDYLNRQGQRKNILGSFLEIPLYQFSRKTAEDLLTLLGKMGNKQVNLSAPNDLVQQNEQQGSAGEGIMPQVLPPQPPTLLMDDSYGEVMFFKSNRHLGYWSYFFKMLIFALAGLFVLRIYWWLSYSISTTSWGMLFFLGLGLGLILAGIYSAYMGVLRSVNTLVLHDSGNYLLHFQRPFFWGQDRLQIPRSDISWIHVRLELTDKTGKGLYVLTVQRRTTGVEEVILNRKREEYSLAELNFIAAKLGQALQVPYKLM
jgi:hypothetical protein